VGCAPLGDLPAQFAVAVEQGEASGELALEVRKRGNQHGLGREQVSDMAAVAQQRTNMFDRERAAAFGAGHCSGTIKHITGSHGHAAPEGSSRLAMARARLDNSGGMEPSGTQWSTSTCLNALAGMSGHSASPGSCTTVVPRRRRIS